MSKILIWAMMAVSLLPAAQGRAATAPRPAELLVLCYHSIQPAPQAKNSYTIPQNLFAEQMDYLYTHGYHPVAIEDMVAAYRGTKPLPEKAVLLTFDDGYRSYAEFVVPFLERYGFPSMLAVVGGWIENGPPQSQALPEPLMTWDQIKKVADHPLVTIASHSYDLHRSIPYTPQGNTGAVVAVRAYSGQEQRYETEASYRRKLRRDFQQQETVFLKRIGRKPRAMVWPYGHSNAIALETARDFGMQATFVLDGKARTTARLDDPGHLNRVMVINEPMESFILGLKPRRREPVRAVQVDLDLVYSARSAQETDRNLGRLIDRLVQLKVNTVYLQAFADPEGTGNIRQVYFHNRFLPVRADIFAHAVHQIMIRGIKVYAWMPVLSYRFPDSDFNQRNRVRPRKAGGSDESEESGYRRLSPFSTEVQARIAGLYEDLASGAQIHGVLFQDDAYLGDEEDFHPAALAAFSKHAGRPATSEDVQPGAPLAEAWMHFKTRELIVFVDRLADAVRRHRPDALFARNLYAPLLIRPEAEGWFAQNYERFLEAYDYVVVMAYPRMEQAEQPLAWLRDLAATAVRTPRGVQKTVFKLQTYDWRRSQWIPASMLLRQMRAVLAAGIRHLGYYPDNFWNGQPDIDVLKLEMSTRSWIGGE